ncbi:hypothetical protein SLS62_008094 [Diatrype stigma]|uniref:Beta-lactamase-related domain-containing protein n=1 Tax=Diatrype stigma TaxID=117547 RepID=A0AAN9UL47_9PEZI
MNTLRLIEQPTKITDTADLSLGVYQYGESNYYANFGFHNVEAELPVSDQTIFADCPLTKLCTSMAMASLIDDPSNMTITDCLCHRTGMSVGDFYLGSENNIVIAKIAGLFIDKVAGPWADIFRQRFFGPLGMKRTFTKALPDGAENVAKAYNTLDDGTPVEIPLVKAGEGSFGGSIGDMFTYVDEC